MLDRNSYYGGASASLNLTELYNKFKPGVQIPDELQHHNPIDYQCDLTPKFIMSDGTLVKMIQTSGATRYLDFMPVEGSFCVRNDTLHKVPATANEAINTSLVGFFQKRYMKNLFQYVVQCQDLTTEDSSDDARKLSSTTSRTIIMEKNWCSENTTEFIGHCVALHQDDAYLDQPAIHTARRMRLYARSLAKHQNSGSPFIYPEYGLGGLPEAFARICSIHGGDFMLSRETDSFLFDETTGNVVAVTSTNPDTQEKEGCTVGSVVGDPSYFGEDRRTQQGSVMRCICLLRGPVQGLPSGLESAQIIYPQGQCTPKRSHDIYISVVGNRLKCTPENVWSATMSTMMESDSATNGMSEFADALKLLGGEPNIVDLFFEVTPYYVPLPSHHQSTNIFVSKSCDATTHFESTTLDIVTLYEKITGERLKDLDKCVIVGETKSTST
jgi:Rab GDP dissociation inhibitor